MSVTETITNQPIVTSIYTTTCDSVSPVTDEASTCAVCLSEEEYLEIMEGSSDSDDLDYEEDYGEEKKWDTNVKLAKTIQMNCFVLSK